MQCALQAVQLAISSMSIALYVKHRQNVHIQQRTVNNN